MARAQKAHSHRLNLPTMALTRIKLPFESQQAAGCRKKQCNDDAATVRR